MSLNLKKTKYQTLIRAKHKTKELASLSKVCHCFGLKRDAYYKYKNRADKRKDVEQKIINIVKKRSKSLPREGVLKLMKSLKEDFKKQQVKVGRDSLFKTLKEHKILTLRKKYSARTTNALHRFYKYNNIIKGV